MASKNIISDDIGKQLRILLIRDVATSIFSLGDVTKGADGFPLVKYTNQITFTQAKKDFFAVGR